MKFLYLFTLLILSNILFSQETTGVLKGKILDDKNNSIYSASIILHQKLTGLKQNTTSQKDGFFTFNQLQPASDYEIEIISLGFQNYKEENIQIQLGKTTNLNFQLISSSKQLNEVLVNGSSNSNKK